MAIAVTQSGATAAATGASTLVFTVPIGGIPLGSLIIVVAVGTVFSSAPTSCADSKSNTYGTDSSNTGNNMVVFSAQAASALVSGDTITVTYGGTLSIRGMIVAYATGIVTSAAHDKSNATGTGLTTHPISGLSGTLTQANELVLGCFGVIGTETQSAEDPAFTALATDAVNGVLRLHAAYAVVAATTSIQYGAANSITLSGSARWGCSVDTYLGTALAVFIPYTSVYPALLAQ